MKILVFVEEFMAPTLTFVYNEIRELSKFHEVKVLCTIRSYEDVSPFTNITVIPFKQNAVKRKIRWHAEKHDLFVSRKNRKFKTEVKKLMDEYKPDIIHCHFGYESIKFLDNIDELAVPIFVSFHGYDASELLKKKSYVNKLNFFFERKNIIPIYVSNYVKNNLLKVKVNMQNAELLYYGIDVDFFNPESRSKIHTDDVFTFLQISTFTEKKGHIYTLQAFKKMLETVDDKRKYKLILAGGYLLIDQIKQITVEMGLADYVEFPGHVKPIDGKKLLLEANAFVHHSITASNGDAEGLPNAIIEAMAMELPVISTWHAGIPELIEDGVNGYLVKEKDVDTYVKRMKDILEWKYQPKNREKIVSHFSNEVHCQSLIKIYNKYL